jgi:DNA polymerase V
VENRTYVAIDLKSFYASVECVERGLDPLTANLVVADVSRTEKTICLAVSPALKACGIPGRARLFEVVQKVGEINSQRLKKAPGRVFTGSSCDASKLASSPELSLDYIAAPPRMAFYIEYSTRIYNIYLKYIAPEDIHVYSIDEVFMDVTDYLGTYKLSPRGLAMKIILDVLSTTGITATAGIGTNMYLARSPWISGPSTSPPTKTACGSRSLTRCRLQAASVGAPAADGFLAGRAEGTRRSLRQTEYSPWATYREMLNR